MVGSARLDYPLAHQVDKGLVSCLYPRHILRHAYALVPVRRAYPSHTQACQADFTLVSSSSF